MARDWPIPRHSSAARQEAAYKIPAEGRCDNVYIVPIYLEAAGAHPRIKSREDLRREAAPLP